MKKLYAMMVFLAFFGFLDFGHSGELKELGFILFAPNSSDRFIYEEQTIIQLDNVADYLRGRNLAPGQIHIHGYAASAKNDIEPINLSRERAFFVMHELQRRGLAYDVFSAPVAYGEVNLWGSNITEEERNPNRRVIILLDDYYLTGAALIHANESRAFFPWIFLIVLLLLLGIALIAANLFFMLKRRNKSRSKTTAKIAVAQTKNNTPIATLRGELRNIESSTELQSALAFENRGSPLGVVSMGLVEANNADSIKKGKFSCLEKTIHEILFDIPLGMFFDVHTVVEKLLQEHDDVYLTNVGHYTSAAQYHSRISAIIAHETDLVEKAGNSYSKNIHDKFSECHLFKRKK